MSLRSAILASAAKAQAEVTPGAGDVYVRGGRLAFVLEAGDTVRWLDGEGEQEQGSMADFRSRALLRIGLPSGRSASYLDGAWQIAGARGIDPYLRIMALTPVLGRAPTLADRGAIASWLRSLIQRVEPMR